MGPFGRSAGLVAVVLLVAIAVPGGSAFHARTSPTTSGPGTVGWDPSVLSTPAASASTAVAVAAPAVSASDCAALSSEYANWFAGRLPMDVRSGLQGPCYVGHDAPAMSFLSNASGSASRVHFGVELPVATGSAGVLAAFELGLWVGGVTCSLDGASYLDLQLNPPYSSLGLAPSANWSLQAPVWDLAPPGSCDPACTNDTAYVTVDGLAYCEDDVAVAGPGTYTPTGWGSFAPGDDLSVDLVGAAGGTAPLAIYVNDTTRPTSDLAWTLGAASTSTGTVLTPLFDAALAGEGGWGSNGAVSAGWATCPSPAATPALSACNSYDGPRDAAAGVPTLTAATFWNGTAHAYDGTYGFTATSSSSGGCSGEAAPCGDFATYGGTGAYPTWTLRASGGAASWTLGGASATTVTDWGGATAQYPATGSSAVEEPTTIAAVNATDGAGTVAITATVAAPGGVAAVNVTGYYCFGSSTPSVASVDATRAGGSPNTSREGNWTASFGTSGFGGTFHYWIRTLSDAGVWSTPTLGSLAASGGSTCTFPSVTAPSFTAANVTPVADGYLLNWTETSAAVLNFTVVANASGSVTTVVGGSATSLLVPLGVGATSFSLTVEATSVTGSSATSAPVSAPPTLAGLGATVVGTTATPLWRPANGIGFVATAVGGAEPYAFHFRFGDGTTSDAAANGSSASVLHDFGTFEGTAYVTVVVTDALGDVASSPGLSVPVWATPLGVHASAVGGDGLVSLTWSAPLAPASPVTGYVVRTTEDPAAVPFLGGAWPGNLTARGITVWNTSALGVNLSIPNGVTLYAELVATSGFGVGQLASPAVVEATPAAFSLGAIGSAPGGPAPFTDPLSAWVTNGTNDLLTSATYSVGTTPYAAMVTPGSGGVYVNATIVLAHDGLIVVVLHVSDEFANIALATADVLVTPGVAPTVTLVPPTPNGWFGWAGASLPFGAVAGGGIGPYDAEWAFGDGTTASGLNVTHAFAGGGNYTLHVTVTDTTTGGSLSTVQPITIYALPSVAVSAAPGPDGPLSFSFTGLETGGSAPGQFTWSFGDGATGTGSPAIHDYAAPGSYDVNLSVVDPQGKTGSTTFVLTVTGGTSGGNGGTFFGATATDLGPITIVLGIAAALLLVTTIYFAGRTPPSAPEEVPERPPFRDESSIPPSSDDPASRGG